MIRRILIFAIGLFLAIATTSAKEQTDSAYMALYHRYYQLYDTDSAEEFHRLSAILQQNYKERGKTLYYYKIKQNEIIYDSEHEKAYEAIKKANDLLEEMRNSKVKYYELPYMSLGYIFERRGSYGIAVRYYQEAINSVSDTDSTGRAHLYAQMAGINFTHDIEQSKQWIERMGEVISSDSLYYKLYLTLKGQLYFNTGDSEKFFENKQEFEDFTKRHGTLDDNGEYLMRIMEKSFNRQYDEALKMLDEKVLDYDAIGRCDIRVRIYEMMGRTDLAIIETEKRRDIRDSISSDMIYDNLYELNADIGLTKYNEEVASERLKWLKYVIGLLVVVLGLTISRYISYRRYQKTKENQNKQLEKALNEAKESERMKDIFIQHISQEMRTQLDDITDCVQSITDDSIELTEAETNKMIQNIGKDTDNIIDIVDDLLEVSLEESKKATQE